MLEAQNPQVQDPQVAARYQFSHETTYRYSGEVTFGPHKLVLRPRENHLVRLEHFELQTWPPARIQWSEDILGNIIATASFDKGGEELRFRSEFVVEKMEHAGNPQAESRVLTESPPYYLGIEEGASYLFRRSVFPTEVEAVRDWVFGLKILPPQGQKAAIIDELTGLINQQISYQRREEAGVQTPRQTLKKGTGSCRDTAVLLMEAARSLGFAARFVSGYLESQNSQVGKGSTHAWVEVYLPDHGWMGFDPSIGRQIGRGHVAVATSYHPRGIMPLSGKFSGNGHRYLGMEVAISSKKLTDGSAELG